MRPRTKSRIIISTGTGSSMSGGLFSGNSTSLNPSLALSNNISDDISEFSSWANPSAGKTDFWNIFGLSK